MVFKPITSYFDDNYMPYKTFNETYSIKSHAGMYAFMNNRTKEYAKIPSFLVKTIIGKDRVSYVIGPWIFLNGFEDTKEGKYLISIFPYYFCMTPRTKEKVDDILNTYNYWCQIHRDYVERMQNANY